MQLPLPTLTALRAILRMNRVSGRQLAADLGMAPQNVSGALLGRRPIPDEALLRLLDTLGLRLTDGRLDIPSGQLRHWRQRPLDPIPSGEDLRLGFDGTFDYSALSPYRLDPGGHDFVYDQARRVVILSKLDRAVIVVLQPSGDPLLVRPVSTPLHGPAGRFIPEEDWEALSTGNVSLKAVLTMISHARPLDWQQLIEACIASDLSPEAVLHHLLEQKALHGDVIKRLVTQARAGLLPIPEATMRVMTRA